MKLSVENLGYSVRDKSIINGLDLEIEKGQFVGIVGPNGSGKSTLLKNIYRSLKPTLGIVKLDNEDIYTINQKQLAKKLAVLSQENCIFFDFKVDEIVGMGRHPHKKLFEGDNEEDLQIVWTSLDKVKMTDLAKRKFDTLSGGEKQRVLIARALAQQAEFLVLDEPTNHLDISCQMQILKTVKDLDITIFSAIHDLNLAALYCDKIYILKDGKIANYGTPQEVFTPKILKEVFGVNADVIIHPNTKQVAITYLP